MIQNLTNRNFESSGVILRFFKHLDKVRAMNQGFHRLSSIGPVVMRNNSMRLM